MGVKYYVSEKEGMNKGKKESAFHLSFKKKGIIAGMSLRRGEELSSPERRGGLGGWGRGWQAARRGGGERCDEGGERGGGGGGG